MKHNKRYKDAKKITLIGAVVNTILGLIKVVGGIIFQSHALFADGIHSFSDLFIDAMVLLASKYGSQAADEGHPYGHQKIETAATLVLAALLILAGAGIAWDSIIIIIHHQETTPQVLAIPIAIASIIANAILFYYTNIVGKRINSPLVIANAWHHLSDSASSGIVLLGLIGTLLGFKLLDPIAAIIIGGMIIKMGVNYGWSSVKELVDTGIEKDKLLEIVRLINQIHGVQHIHQLRGRMMGKDMFIDVHILVAPHISVSEGHHIAQSVHQNLISKIAEIKDVTIHVDPEDDEMYSPSLFLPSRHTLETKLIKKWQEDFPEIDSWTIHYLNGKISIELLLKTTINNLDKLTKRIEHDILLEPNIHIIRLLNFQKNIISNPQSN